MKFLIAVGQTAMPRQSSYNRRLVVDVVTIQLSAWSNPGLDLAPVALILYGLEFIKISGWGANGKNPGVPHLMHR